MGKIAVLVISNREQCNGCKVCADICPKGAISFTRDIITGFDYPHIDKAKCIHCDRCSKDCPQIHPVRRSNRELPEVLAAWSEDDEKRLLCTSGGIFYELAQSILQREGVVVACRYTDDYRGAFHCLVQTDDELIPLCGSKHVQSDTLHVYSKVHHLLNSGKEVFFVGTPCQVAALYRFLNGDHPGLLTADFICNSINSPKAQEKYIDYLEEVHGGKVVFSRAKDKRYGWNNFGSSAKFDNGTEYYADRNTDMRVVGYHHGHLFIRDSCCDCQYKVLPRNADITLGDFWGIQPDERNPKLEMGTSVILINTQKGEEAIDRVPTIVSYGKTFGEVLEGNRSLFDSAPFNPNRLKAFSRLDSERFDVVVNRFRDDRRHSTFVGKIRSRIARAMRKVAGL